jgi:hypothetical protein
MPFYHENIIVGYDSPIDEYLDRQLRAARFAPWSLKVNEWRRLQGEDPVPYGDVHMVNQNVFPHASLAEEDFVNPSQTEQTEAGMESGEGAEPK